MPQFQVELSDGRIVEVESGEEPTHEQLMSALGTWEEPQAAPAQPQLEPPSWLGASTQSASTPNIASPVNLMPSDAVRAAWDESGIPVIPPPIPGSQRYSPTGDILGQPNSEGLTAIANDPRGFVRSIPQIAMGALTAPGQLAYQTAADVVSKVAGQPEYGGNLAAGMQGMEPPVEKFLADVSKTNPKLAVAGKVGKSLTEMAPLGAVGMLPKALGVLASAGFTADMIAKAPALFKDYAEEINKPKEEQDPNKLTTLQSDILQTFTFAPLAGAHAVRGGIDAVSQRLNTERQAALSDTQLQPGVPREGISETVKPPTQGVQNEAQSQVQLQIQQPEASRPSQVQERAGEIVQEQPESRAEVASLSERQPGEVTPKEMAALPSADAASLFDSQREKGNANQNDGVLAGMKLTAEAVPELIQLREAAQAEWMKAFQAGDEVAGKGAFGKVTWLNGAIEGAKREGPNYKAVTESKAAPSVPEKASLDDLTVAIRVNGEPITGGGSHMDIALKAGDADVIEAASKPENQGFVYQGKFISREKAAELVGEKLPLTSERLTEMREKAAPASAPKPSEAVAGETLAPAPSPESVSAKNAPTQAQGRILEMFQKLRDEERGKAILETLQEEGKTPKQVVSEFWQETYPNLPKELQAKFESLLAKETGFKPGSVIATGPKGERIQAKDWSEVYSEKEAPQKIRHLEGTERGLISMMETANRNRDALTTSEIKAVDWASATEDVAETAEPVAPGQPPKPEIVEMGAGIPIPKFADRKMSPLDRVTASHSGKLQKSFSEARLAQKEIKQAVPSDNKRNAISIYREAAGDMAVLKDWETRAKQKWMRDAARDAQSLTAKESALLPKVASTYSTMETRGNTYDVLGSHRDNYVTHIWDVKQPGTGFGGGRLKDRFRFAKARTFNTFFEGDQAGFKPKTLDIAKLLPAYIHEMNRVIADRQAVRDLAKGTMPDGSPMVTPRGNAKVVEGAQGKAVLVSPKTMREADTSDYKVMADQSALSNWTWEGKDTDGNPVFVKADLAVHPDVYRRLNAMMGQSELRKWSRDPVTGTAQIPRAIMRGLDTAQSAMKREMFGLLAPFHQVQEGTHAVGHLVNPFFGLEKVDLVNNPKMADAANHGLMLLPDRASAQVYMEGVGTKSSLLSQAMRKIPVLKEQIPGVKKNISDVIDGYQDYLFHQYIPSLKYKTYEAMVGRNTKLYAKELASGEMTPADVKLTSAEQANAAYGHLNYALLDRNPTNQHYIQLAALAPDFLEARARFVVQGVKGLRSKVGHEQFKAIAILAAAQAGTAALLSQLLGVDYDPEHPFEVIYKGRRYSMRSVPEDIFGLIKDTRQFAYSRVNPLTVKGTVQLATGLNYRGEKVSATETMAELLAGYIPITARSIPALRNLTETGRHTPVTPLQQLAGSLGLRISRYSPVSETYRLAGEWMEKQKLPKDRGSYPVSKYQQLRYALEDGDLERAKAEYETLKKDTPARKVRDGFAQSLNHPFTGSQADDKKFVKTLTGYDKELYDEAIRTRKNILKAFYSL